MSENTAPVVEQPTNDVVQEDTSTDTTEQVEVSGDEVSPDEIAEAKEAINAAAKSGASDQQIKDMIKQFELKVNGKTITKKINLSDEKELIRELQLAAAGREAMTEAAELKRLFAQEIGRMKENPWEVLAELGLDPDQLAEMRIQQKIEELSKTPEQKEAERKENERLALQKELEEARQKLKQKEEQEEQLKREKFESEVAQDLENSIIKALDAHKDISASPKIIARIADTMLWSMENGFDDVTPEDVIPQVRKELRQEINDLLSNLPEDFLEEFIGQKNIDRLRKKRLDAAKKAKSVNTVSNVAPKVNEVKTEETPKEKRKLEDFMRLY